MEKEEEVQEQLKMVVENSVEGLLKFEIDYTYC